MTAAEVGAGSQDAGPAPSRLKRLLLRLFRVDEQPAPPPGSPESLRVFRASPKYFRYKLLSWGAGQAGALIGLVASLGFEVMFLEFIEFGSWTRVVRAAVPLFVALFLVQLVGSFAVLRLGYEMRWYMVSDRALRIRYGIFSLREQTMTVVNIQNISVKRGPLQRLFGIADLEVRTASGGGSDDDEDSLSRGLLQGLDNAEEVRDLLLGTLRRSRGAGLGDPDDGAVAATGAGLVAEGRRAASSPVEAGEDAVLAAARDLLAECRALRRAVETR